MRWCAVAVLTWVSALSAAAPPAPVPDDRMAAWHQTLVAVNEVRPNACLSTYVNDRFTQTEVYGLAKLVVGVAAGPGGELLWPARAEAVVVEDLPGGVRATWRAGGVRVSTEVLPLLEGHDPPAWQGAACFSVSTEPATPVVVRCGGSASLGMFHTARAAWLQADGVGDEGDSVAVDQGAGLLRSTRHPLAVAVRSSGTLAVEPGEGGGTRLALGFAQGRGTALLAFSPDAGRAQALADLDADAARAAVDRHYRWLLASRIQTPVPHLDAAFRSALLTLEYNWVAPYGWTECIHHWYSLWHMQHSPAAEWLGQADRSRQCLLSHAAALLPSGAVPQLSPGGGLVHRDFGGSNQFYLWQVRHYLRQTGDREALRALAPALDRVLAQTWGEYDRDGDGLLAWGQQIGNQEDYVSTPGDGTSPTVEGLQMLRTRAMVARLLGDADTAAACDRRVEQLTARLRAALWQPDLGRFAFYRDPLGVVRPDGQYHTLLYPALWDVLGPLDSWTSMRHLRDRLTGPDGEVYCSANFPWHAVGTWGMQAGAAQQPWAAMGLARLGRWNETHRPLEAAAAWAMDANHRGSWPEISVESTPAWFSPPAGLFVQATVEALFGLEVDQAEGCLQVSPSFPDAWPAASLALPEFAAEYRRQGDRREYRVQSRQRLRRRLRWHLPPGRVVALQVNGRAVPCELAEWVAGMVLRAETPPATDTRIVLVLRPAAWRVAHPGSVAEGDPLRVSVAGAEVLRVDDRCGVLQSVDPPRADGRGGCTVNAVVRPRLLDGWAGYGRLGQLAFSRRTFFLLCRCPDGAKFWAPVDLAVLPRYEAAARDGITPMAEGGRMRLLVRNNTTAPLAGPAWLTLGRVEAVLGVTVPARAEGEVTVDLPRDRLALLSPGDNGARLLLPGQAEVAFTVAADGLFAQSPELGAWMASRLAPVPLPEAALRPDTTWREWREWPAYGHWPWANSRPPLEALAGAQEVSVPGLPGVRFELAGRRLAVVSYRAGSPSLSLALGGQACRKLYLLVLPLLDNHDTFTAVARVDVTATDGTVLSRTLRFPGDLDWWCPEEVVGQFATAAPPRPDRLGLLPRLAPDQTDWAEGRAPAFPQPEFWATCRVLKTASAVFNVVELDLGQPVALRELTVAAVGAEPALGVVAACVERATGHQALAGTAWQPPPELREPVTLFRLNRAGEPEGWQLEGAFSVAAVPSLFSAPTLNSLARAGESATGRARSPAFVLDGRWLRLRLQGGHSRAASGPGALVVRLLDAGTEEILYTLNPPGTHIAQSAAISLEAWPGRRVCLELDDQNTDPSYAWIGLSEVSLSAQ